MELSLLGTLKEKLINNKVLADVQTYFLDHFGENQQFMDLGEEYSDPFLEGILRQVARQPAGPSRYCGQRAAAAFAGGRIHPRALCHRWTDGSPAVLRGHPAGAAVGDMVSVASRDQVRPVFCSSPAAGRSTAAQLRRHGKNGGKMTIFTLLANDQGVRTFGHSTSAGRCFCCWFATFRAAGGTRPVI